jgi:hypothetical protein
VSVVDGRERLGCPRGLAEIQAVDVVLRPEDADGQPLERES